METICPKISSGAGYVGLDLILPRYKLGNIKIGLMDHEIADRCDPSTQRTASNVKVDTKKGVSKLKRVWWKQS